jgi:hypothetical protein
VLSLQGRAGPAQDGSLGPNGLAHFEQSLAALDGAPLGIAAKLELLTIVDDYVFGHLLRSAEVEARGAMADQPPSARVEAVLEFTRGLLATGQYPRMAALVGDPAAATLADPGAQEARFEHGLRLLIDSAAAEVAADR